MTEEFKIDCSRVCTKCGAGMTEAREDVVTKVVSQWGKAIEALQGTTKKLDEELFDLVQRTTAKMTALRLALTEAIAIARRPTPSRKKTRMARRKRLTTLEEIIEI